MKTYQIVQTVSGLVMADIKATSKTDALNQLARLAGYKDHADACTKAEGGATLVVLEVP